MQKFSEFLHESSLSRVLHHSKESHIAMISASRGENTPEQNNHAHKALEHDLRAKGYGLVHVHGEYTENKGTPQEKQVKEKSFLAIGKKGTDHEEMLNHVKGLGEKYKQDSVLFKASADKTAKLHGTSHTGTWLKHGETHDVGEFHPNRAAEFQSHLKQPGKSFTFSEQVVPKFYMDNTYFTAKEKAETMVYTLK